MTSTSIQLGRSESAAARRAESNEFDFARVVGAAAWSRLAPPIRQRFSEKPKHGEAIHYDGIMHVVHCSAAGWLLAQAARLIGTPFALHAGTDVPVTITLRGIDHGAAIVWERTYWYPDHPAAVVSSEKRMAADGGLLECVGAGIAMRLALEERCGALHFLSLGYFCKVGFWRIPLPNWLSTHVIHEDLGGGRFRFAMTVRNRLFGLLFHQDGIFHSKEV